MIKDLYAKYLLADRLNKIFEAADVRADFIKLDNHGYLAYDVHIQASSSGRREGEGDNDAERTAVRLLDAMPDLTIERNDGLIYLTGTANNGLTYRLYTGTGSCERVQVGTRTVPAEPAKPEREEPIYEVRCVDPLNELVNA